MYEAVEESWGLKYGYYKTTAKIVENAIEVQECIVVIHGKIRNKRRNMEEKRDVIYLSSREAFFKVL